MFERFLYFTSCFDSNPLFHFHTLNSFQPTKVQIQILNKLIKTTRLNNTLHLYIPISINLLLSIFSLHLHKLRIHWEHGLSSPDHACQTIHHIINVSSTSHPIPQSDPSSSNRTNSAVLKEIAGNYLSTFPSIITLDVTNRCSTWIPISRKLSINSRRWAASCGTKNAVLHDPFDRSFILSLPGRFPRESVEEKVWLCLRVWPWCFRIDKKVFANWCFRVCASKMIGRFPSCWRVSSRGYTRNLGKNGDGDGPRQESRVCGLS